MRARLMHYGIVVPALLAGCGADQPGGPGADGGRADARIGFLYAAGGGRAAHPVNRRR